MSIALVAEKRERSSAPRKKVSGSTQKAIVWSVVVHVVLFLLIGIGVLGSNSNSHQDVDSSTEFKQAAPRTIMQATFIDANVLQEASRARAKKRADEQALANRKAAEKKAVDEKLAKLKEQARAVPKRLEKIAQAEQALQGEQDEVPETVLEQEAPPAKAPEKSESVPIEDPSIAQKRRALEERLAKKWHTQQKQQAALSEDAIDKEAQQYQSMITQVILDEINIDGFAGKICQLSISISNVGVVKGVDIGQGDPFLCLEAKRALLSANTLPVSSHPLVYEKMKRLAILVKL